MFQFSCKFACYQVIVSQTANRQKRVHAVRFSQLLSGPVTTFFHGSGVKMQNVVTVFLHFNVSKTAYFVQFLYEKIRNNVGYS